jgi:hypothetical protein
MKRCPKCGLSVAESSATCPDCQHSWGQVILSPPAQSQGNQTAALPPGPTHLPGGNTIQSQHAPPQHSHQFSHPQAMVHFVHQAAPGTVPCPHCRSYNTFTASRTKQMDPTSGQIASGYALVFLGIVLIPLCLLGLLLIIPGLSMAQGKGSITSVNESRCSHCGYQWEW